MNLSERNHKERGIFIFQIYELGFKMVIVAGSDTTVQDSGEEVC